MRKSGTKQVWRCALVIILWASGFQLSLYAQQVAKLSPKVMAVVNMPLVELKDDDPPLLRLKKERFNAALNETKARFDLYNKPEEKAEVLQRHLDVYLEAEANLEKQVKDGLAPQADLERLRYNRVSTEIDLFNIKNVHDEHESAGQPTPK